MATGTADHVINAVNVIYFGREAEAKLPELMQLASDDPEWAESHDSTKYVVNAVQRANKNGKVAALRYLYDEFQALNHEYTKWHFLSVVETNDMQVLADLNQRRTAITRGTSFFEQYFKSNLGIDPGEHTSLAGLIDDAEQAGLITKLEQKILQFVRELRNDVAHYTWLDPKFNDSLLHLSVEALLYVVGNIMIREHSQHTEIVDDPTNDFDPNELVNDFENESGWVYDERDNRWFTIEE